jgi:hypothetical protein
VSVIKWMAMLIGLSSVTRANEWRDRWMSEMDQIGNLPIHTRIERLGTAVGAKSTAGGWQPSDDQLAVANRAVDILLTIPGHAEYYRDRVLKAQADYRDEVFNKVSGAKHNDYITEQSIFLQTLCQLPSPETVRVLGDFLSDNWFRPTDPNRPQGPHVSPMSLNAARTFGKLPLASKPANNRLDHEAEGALPAWQSWYEQIKAGKRTFRFEGDPTEYDLNGPAPGQKIVQISRDRKRDEERAAGGRRGSSPGIGLLPPMLTEHPGTAGGIVAACVLFTAAVWRYLRKRSFVS